MALDPNNPILSKQFADLARSGIGSVVAGTWNPDLPRDPRLLVPVDVEALVVAPGSDEPHADVAARLLRAPATAGETFATDTEHAAPP